MQIVLADVLLLCAAQVLVQLQVGCRKWGCAGAEIGGFHHQAVSYGSCGELCEVVGDAVGGAERMGYGEARGVRREVRGAHPTDMHNT